MKYNTITLLVYGNNISSLEPSFNYKDVQLVKKQTTENKNYLFLTIKINPSAGAGIVKINFKQNYKEGDSIKIFCSKSLLL